MAARLKISVTIMPESLGPDRRRIKAFCAAVAREVQAAFPEATVACVPGFWPETAVSGLPEADAGREEGIRERVAAIVQDVFLGQDGWRREEAPPGREPEALAAPPTADAPADLAAAAGEAPPPPGPAPGDRTERARRFEDAPAGLPAAEEDLLAGGMFFKKNECYTLFLPHEALAIRIDATARRRRYAVARTLPTLLGGAASCKRLFGGVGRSTTAGNIPEPILREFRAVALRERGR